MTRPYRHLWPILAALGAVLFYVGGCSQTPDNGIAGIAEIKHELALVRAEVIAANQKLDQLDRRHWWFGAPPAMKPGEHSIRTAEQQAPDIHLAIARALQSAAALVGNEQVAGYFEDMASDIGKKLVPLDPLGVADKKARELAGQRINNLLTQ